MEETDASRIGAETNTTEEQQSTTVEERQNLLETPVRSERRIIVDEEEDEQYSANVENVNLEATQPSDETPNNDSPPMTFYRGRSRTPEEMQQLIQIWKRGNGVVILYMLPMTIALLTVLIVDWKHDCDKPLKDWAVTQICIQSGMLLINYAVLSRLPSSEMPPDMQQRILNSLSVYYFLNRILNFMYSIWFIVGMVWTFQAMHSGVCSQTAPFLFRMCFSLVIMQLVMFGFIILFCCCSCAFIILRIFVYPNGLQNRNRGATKRIIRSLPCKKFEEGSIPKEDANCAICLSDYEVNENIRYLPCNHHFHANCVDQWLITNKTCPFCKRDIDQPAENNNNTNSNTVPTAEAQV